MSTMATTSVLSKQAFVPQGSKLEGFEKYQREDAIPKLVELLWENHQKYHCFFNMRGFHNHSTHQLLADYTLGATADDLARHFDREEKHYLQGFKFSDKNVYDPYTSDKVEFEKIHLGNWTKHLGNPRYYWSYLYFFQAELNKHGLAKCLETYVFDRQANDDGAEMMNRFYGSVIHGLIHYGYALEFDLLSQAAQALSMAASTATNHLFLWPAEWRTKDVSAVKETRRLVQLMQEMANDPRLSSQSLGLSAKQIGLPNAPFEQGGSAYGLIHEYADRWSVTVADTIDVEKAIEDLALYSVLMLGAVPKLQGKYCHDFFLMHCNNAHIFTKLYLSTLPPPCQKLFLRGLAVQFLYYWVARGRPTFTTQHWKAEHERSKQMTWDQLFKTSREHDDQHFPKIVRTLFYHSRFLHQAKGSKNAFELLGVPGLFDDVDRFDYQDETLDPFFLTAIQLQIRFQGSAGDEANPWDLNGFYHDVELDH